MISGADKEITVFSKEGKLYQIEYSFNAVKNSGYTSIGVRGKDSVVVVTQKKIPDKSIVPDSVNHIFKVSENIGVLFTGYNPDIKNVLMRIRQIAADFQDDFGYSIPVNVLAQKVGGEFQRVSQVAYMRPLCVISMLFSLDDEKGPQLIKVDPAGHFLGYKACATGEKEQSAVNQLERELKKNPDLDFNQTMKTAIISLQNVIFI